ncbi:hypothetical protein QUF72_09035 [Desulfobacterales bacterium HSG2]|nr:hypothetical protein [Desulfobacterales bacterium HSG2]
MLKKRTIVIIFFTAFLLTGSLLLKCEASNSRPCKLFPVDEGALDESFKTFREQVFKAVRKHDVRFVSVGNRGSHEKKF